MAKGGVSVEKKGPSKDPTHTEDYTAMVKEAYAEYSPFGKMLCILNGILLMFVWILPNMLAHKLGLRSNKSGFRLKRVTTYPEVYVGEYTMPIGSSNTVVIKGKDGKLLVRSPPDPLPYIVAQFRELGDVGVILVSIQHDTYAAKWKDMYPKAVVVSQKESIPLVNNRVKVDVALEDAMDSLLPNYYITRSLPFGSCCRHEDVVLFLELEKEKVVALLGCGFTNREISLLNPFDWPHLAGGTGLRVLRPFGILFIKNHKGLEQLWSDIANTPNLYGLIFLHGQTLMGEDTASRMKASHPGREFALFSKSK